VNPVTDPHTIVFAHRRRNPLNYLPPDSEAAIISLIGIIVLLGIAYLIDKHDAKKRGEKHE